MRDFMIAIDKDLEGLVTREELEAWAADCKAKYRDARGINVYVDSDGWLGWEPIVDITKFDRIRRITGYLVGTLDRFNDGKRAEEHDRVKHCCTSGCDFCEGE